MMVSVDKQLSGSQGYRSIPDEIRKKGRLILDSGLKRVLDEFEGKYCN